MDEKKHAVKLTVTFSDGSTASYDVFMASVVERGLIPAGKDDDGNVLYMAGEGLAVSGITHIAADPEVVVALASTTMRTISNLADNIPPDVLPQFLEALLSLSSKQTTLYHDCRSVKRKLGQG